MKEVPLTEYLAKHSQIETAATMDVHQGTVSKMHSSGRDIRLVFKADGAFSHYYEVKVGKPRAA